MRINSNMAALNAYRNLSNVNNALDKSLERLSSGLRINRAADDAAGLAISEKMVGQVKGLIQAQRNAQDGISMIQTAEGALIEIHSILQRMRELAVQASNDTLTANDRNEIQKEVSQLEGEITRIADTTEFNTKKLINGQAGISATAQNGTYAAGANLVVNGTTYTAAAGGNISAADLGAVVTDIIAGNKTETGIYNISITKEATQGVLSDVAAFNSGATLATDTLTINGVGVKLDATDNLSEIILKINNVTSETGVVAAVGTSGGLDLTTVEYGSSATINVSASNNTLKALGLTTGTETVLSTAGTDVVGTIDGKVALGQGNVLTLSDETSKADGLSITIDSSKLTVTAGSLDFNAAVNAHGQVILQIGANIDQNLTVSINDSRAAALGIDNLKVDTQNAANTAIQKLSDAIDQVSAERSKLGAVQNRLEHTINNLGVAAENITAAKSRIQDVDMAREMMEFTKKQVLSQAGTAMLAQANQKPQTILQLLR